MPSFVRRSVIDKIGPFDGGYTVFGDREFMFRFAATGHKALKLDRTVGLYLENPTSVERANKEIGMQECAALYDDYLTPEKFARLMGLGSAVSPQSLSHGYTVAGCFGMGLYQIDAKAVHALGSPTLLFAKAIELNPENIEALNNMGVIALHRQVYQDALRFLERAKAQANTKQVKVIDHNIEMVHHGSKDPDQLRFLFPPDFHPIRVVESVYSSTCQNYSLNVNKSTLSNSEKSSKKRRRKKEQVKNSLLTSKSIESTPSSTKNFISSVCNKIWPAWIDYLEEDYSSALSTLDQILSNDPDDWAAYELLVDVLLQSGQDMDIPDRLRTLEKRSDIPARMSALVGVGYEASGNLKKALEFVNLALALEPECPRAWNLKGVVAYRNGQSSEAAQFFQKASECDENWGDPWTNMGTLHWDHGAQDKALDCFETGFHLSPTGPNVATTYHIAISETVQYDRARKIFEDVVLRHPDFRKGRFLLIDVLIRLEAYHAALDHIEAILVRFGIDVKLLEAAKAIRSKVGPLTSKKNKLPTLSLCMIVKNKEKYLPRCLESLKPIVDEIIIVDTGSHDSTRDIADVFGARVFDFEWCNDFSAARNFSLEKANCDWILVMDADEIISPKDHRSLTKFIRNRSNNNCAYSIITRNYTFNYSHIGLNNNHGEYINEEVGAGWIPAKKFDFFQTTWVFTFTIQFMSLLLPLLKLKVLRYINVESLFTTMAN